MTKRRNQVPDDLRERQREPQREPMQSGDWLVIGAGVIWLIIFWLGVWSLVA